MNKNVMIIAGIMGIVVVGVTAFYGGVKYGKNQRGATRMGQGGMMQFGGAQGFGGRGGARGAGGPQGGGFVTGEIISKDDTSVTVKMRDGGSKIIFFSDTTQVMKAVTGLATDLAVGQSVMSTGKANADGSVSAESIQIRPAMPTPVDGAQINQPPTGR